MRRLLYGIAILGVAAAGAGGCSTGGCLENRSSVPLAGFYSASTGQAITLNGLRVYGVDAPDTVALVEPGEAVGKVYLPIRSTTSSTSWCIAYKYDELDFEELIDTLTLDYTSRPYFASGECGVVYRYSVQALRYTTHLIDSVALLDSVITNVDTERLRIYFRTSDTQP